MTLSHAERETEAWVSKWADEAEKRSRERAERFNANPQAYMARRAALGWGNDVPRGCTPPEPSKSDLVEMRRAQTIQAIEDFCRDFRDGRDALKERMNAVFQSKRMGLKVVRWSQWQ